VAHGCSPVGLSEITTQHFGGLSEITTHHFGGPRVFTRGHHTIGKVII
jgi:hypothetical protein